MSTNDERDVTVAGGAQLVSMLPIGGKFYRVEPERVLQPGRYVARLNHKRLTATIEEKRDD